MKSNQELLDAFVSGLSNNYNSEQTKYFAMYAVSCIKRHYTFGAEYMHEHGMSESTIEEYRFAFECIEEAFKAWDEWQKELNS